MSADKQLPLRGVRIADFSWHGAGPYATRMLADHGADVIRFESERRMDRLRILPPFRDKVKGTNRSGYWADRNSNKRGITLNLKLDEARAVALRLIAESDVVVSNFTPGTMERMGLGYEPCRAVRPDVIFIEMGTQGAYGRDAARPGYGNTVSAVTGLHHMSGLPDRVPVGTGTNYPDHVVAPAHSAFAILVALRHRRRTGEGQCIDLSQSETMVGMFGPAILDYTVNGRVQQRRGNLADDAAPNGVYPCAGKDRWIAISVTDDAGWEAVRAELELTADTRFDRMLERHHHHAEIDALIAEATRARDPFELAAALQARHVAAEVVKTAEDLVSADQQLRERGHLVVLEHPEMGPSVYTGPPFRLTGVGEPTMRNPAPLLGQHTREVMAEVLGMDDAEIDALIDAEVLV